MAKGLFGGGDGSSATPYLVEDADDLNAIRQRPAASYKLVADIGLGETRYNLGSGWTPIDNFTGVLDGNFHRIINLYINLPASSYVGFFATMNAATVCQIAFDNAVVIGSTNVGIVAGRVIMPVDCKNQLRCYNTLVSGTITADSYAAGVFGCAAWTGWFPSNVNPNDQWHTYFTIVDRCVSNVLVNCGTFASGILNTWSASGSNQFCQVSLNNCAGTYLIYPNVTNCVVVGRLSTVANFNGNVFSSTAGPLSFSNVSTYFDRVMVNRCTLTPGDVAVELTEIPMTATEYLPDLDNSIFSKTPGTTINFKWNLARAYFVKLDDGYYIYDFVNKVFVKKYLTIDSTNVHDAIVNGNSSLDLLTTGCFELLKTYGKFDVISVQNSATSFTSTVNVASFTVGQPETDGDHETLRGRVNFADNNGEINLIETT